MQKYPICAVLTGDLIKSRKADISTVEATLTILRDAAKRFGKAWDIDLRFTRYRGDGWQIVLTNPNLLLDAALYIIARLKADHSQIDTRFSIGVGAFETLGTRDLADATGTAFFTSGDLLDHMGGNRLIALAGQGIDNAEVAIVDLAECVASGWTATQAQAIALWLEGEFKRHEDIAAHLGVTRQAVQSRLSGAGLPYFDNALYAIRNHDFSENTAKSKC
ncbi:hypothetical protein [Cognatiyoonia sp. IB215182]|uniref:hypothetical protein n=1 Tax=Cognatiyoonia sp. IB215182 TaxID=3097353 RepID=UPI002A134E4C|nr:hypothetical protein [Cognatiyoonia sp. IB215182]MDX8353308.1 hypothetical protein [Cognatiyoonia sp. IB215182]